MLEQIELIQMTYNFLFEKSFILKFFKNITRSKLYIT